jgi:hypothetical protein
MVNRMRMGFKHGFSTSEQEDFQEDFHLTGNNKIENGLIAWVSLKLNSAPIESFP